MTATPSRDLTGPDQPVPYTLTPKVLAELDQPEPATGCGCGCGGAGCPVCAGDGWACQQCGLAFFGTEPDDGLCPACEADGGEG
jgi:hypothetical protein